MRELFNRAQERRAGGDKTCATQALALLPTAGFTGSSPNSSTVLSHARNPSVVTKRVLEGLVLPQLHLVFIMLSVRPGRSFAGSPKVTFFFLGSHERLKTKDAGQEGTR